MSAHAARATRSLDAQSAEYEKARGSGWVMFAVMMLMLLGTLNFIEGIAAVGNSHFFVGNAEYVFGDLNTWGWIVLFLSLGQGLVGLGVVLRNQFARWTGVAIASLNAIAQLLFIPAYPFWSLALFSLDILVIYGLIAYGSRESR
jgi:hypothetical protein